MFNIETHIYVLRKCKLHFTLKHKLTCLRISSSQNHGDFKQLQNKITVSTLYCFVSLKKKFTTPHENSFEATIPFYSLTDVQHYEQHS